MRIILALLLREIATSHGRLRGGYLWSLAEPVGGIALLTVVLSMLVPSPPLGRSFALFYAAGYLPFVSALDMAAKVGGALRFSRPLFGYPAVRWPAAIAARFLLNLLLHQVIFWLVVGVLIWWTGEPPPPDPLLMLGGLMLMGIAGLGFGTLNAFLFEALPIWERAWAVLTRPLFLMSGLTFLPEKLPVALGGWIALDPLAQGLGLIRRGLYWGYQPVLADPVLLGMAGLVPLTVGAAMLALFADRLIAED